MKKNILAVLVLIVLIAVWFNLKNQNQNRLEKLEEKKREIKMLELENSQLQNAIFEIDMRNDQNIKGVQSLENCQHSQNSKVANCTVVLSSDYEF